MTTLSPAAYGEHLASLEPPISQATADAAARIFLTPATEGRAA